MTTTEKASPAVRGAEQQKQETSTPAQTTDASKMESTSGETRDVKGPGKRLHESSDEDEEGSEGDGQDTRESSRDYDNDDNDDEEGEEGEIEDGAHDSEHQTTGSGTDTNPPLPPGPPPGQDDGWQAIWDEQHQAYYFYNALTGQSTWTNPRVPEATVLPAALPIEATALYAPGTEQPGVEAGEGEAGHEPTYYQLAHGITDPSTVTAEDIAGTYAATGAFNRFTGKWQAGKNPENYNDENKSKRQMEFYFDVDAAANSHDGRSLKAERQMKKLSKKELKAFREKRKEKKEQKRRAWLKD